MRFNMDPQNHVILRCDCKSKLSFPTALDIGLYNGLYYLTSREHIKIRCRCKPLQLLQLINSFLPVMSSTWLQELNFCNEVIRCKSTSLHFLGLDSMQSDPCISTLLTAVYKTFSTHTSNTQNQMHTNTVSVHGSAANVGISDVISQLKTIHQPHSSSDHALP